LQKVSTFIRRDPLKNESDVQQSHSVHIMEEAAYQYYTGKANGRFPFRGYLRQDKLMEIAEMLDRSLTHEELKLLVGEDGPMVKCSSSDEDNPVQFQPVWWLDVNPDFLGFLTETGSVTESIKEALPRVFGCFYVSDTNIHAYSGSAWWFLKDRERYVICSSPLGQAKKLHALGHWGQTSDAVRKEQEAIMEANRQREEKAERIREQMANVRPRNYSPKMGGGCVPLRKR
jgi:hypothetical protein